VYGPEFAAIYDLVYRSRGKDYQQEAEYVASLIRSRTPAAASLLDVGCGSGLHLACFGEMFDRVAGIELSPAMVAVARGKFADGVVHQGDMRDFDLGRTFDAITCMFGTIGHALTEAELVATLHRFDAHLTPGGVIIVDPWWFDETFTDGYIAGDVSTVDGCTMARVSHARRDGPNSRMNVHYVVAEPATGARHFDETYVARLYRRAEYEAAFRSTGFTTEYIEGVQSGRGIFIAARMS
jgi:SAM-dependent methyltransferase